MNDHMNTVGSNQLIKHFVWVVCKKKLYAHTKKRLSFFINLDGTSLPQSRERTPRECQKDVSSGYSTS